MYAGYGVPDFGLPGMYAQMNPGWFNAPYVLPYTQSQGIPCLQSPEHAQQQPGQPDVRQQQCQQEQGGTHTDMMDVDLDHRSHEMSQAQRARAKPMMVSSATQTLLTGTGIHAAGDEAQGKTASGKRALLVRRACAPTA